MTGTVDTQVGRLAAYALLATPLAFLGLPLYIYLPAHYAALPGIGLAASGLVLMTARLLDLVTDPVVGGLVDRYRHRMSYRAIILAATPLLVVSVLFLFLPPEDAGPLYLLGWVSLTYLAWTLMSVPYYAWGVDLGVFSGSQVRVASWREGGVIIGMLLALVAPVVGGSATALANSVYWMLALVVLAMLVLWWVPQAKPLVTGEAPRLGWMDTWRATGMQARRLLVLHFLNTLANGVPATLFLLYAGKVLGVSATMAGGLLLLYFCSAIAALPFWLRRARVRGRLGSWRLAVLVAALGFIPAVFLGHGDVAIFAVICVVTGACAGADIAMPAALQAELAHRESRALKTPRSAALFGLWGMVSKLGLAVAVGLSFPLLAGLTGGIFHQTESAVLPVLYAGIAVPLKLLVAVLLWRIERDPDALKTWEGKHEMADNNLLLSPAGPDGRV